AFPGHAPTPRTRGRSRPPWAVPAPLLPPPPWYPADEPAPGEHRQPCVASARQSDPVPGACDLWRGRDRDALPRLQRVRVGVRSVVSRPRQGPELTALDVCELGEGRVGV